MKLRSLMLTASLLVSGSPLGLGSAYAQMTPGSGPMVPTGQAIPVPVPVSKGGTSNTTLGAGQLLSGNGTGAVLSNIPISSVVFDGVDSGTLNTYVVTTSSPAYTLTNNSIVIFQATTTNDAASTINVNGTGVKNIYKRTFSGLQPLEGYNTSNGDIVSGSIVMLSYDGTQFELLNPASQIFSQYYTGADQITGSDNARNIDTYSGPYILFDATTVAFVSTFTNTGPTTVNVSGLGPVDVVIATPTGLQPLTGGELVAGNSALLVYDHNTAWYQLINPATSQFVSPGNANDIAYYPAAGSVVSGLATAATGVLNTDSSGNPSITDSPTVNNETINLGLKIPFLPLFAVPYISGSDGTVASTSNLSYDGAQVFAVQIDSATLKTQDLRLYNTGVTGTIDIGSDTSNFTPYVMILPISAGTSGQPLLSSGSGGLPMTYGALSGSGGTFATSSGVPANGCATWSSGNIGTTGSSCASGSGTVNSGTINQMAWYAGTGSAVSGLSTLANGILATNGSSVPSITTTLPFTVPATTGGTGTTTNTLNGVLYGNSTSAVQATAQGAANTVLTANAGAPAFSASPIIGTSITTPIIYGGSGSGSTLTLQATSGAGTTDNLRFYTNGQLQLVINNGGEASFSHDVLSTQFIVEGANSGNISLLGQNNAGTYNFNMPTSAGSAGQFLTSQGGGSTAMTWTSPSAYYGVDGGTANAHTIAAANYALTTGAIITTVLTTTNTGATTVNVNGTGVKNLLKPVVVTGPVALAANDLTTGNAIQIMYDGTQYQLMSR